MSGWLFLGFGALVGIADFVVGLSFSRKTGEELERNPDGTVRSPEQINRLGRIVMIFAPIFFLVFAALAFGYLPAAGIEPISFN